MSQDIISQTLIDLSEWTSSEVQENLDRVLPVLQSSLEKSNHKALSLQAVQALLGICLPCVAIGNIEDDILQHALPAAKALFIETIDSIQVELLTASNLYSDEVINTLTSLLNCSNELLNCLDLTLHHVMSLGRIEASAVPSLPKAVVSILYEAFRHIKNSKAIYGEFLQNLRDVLMTLFHRSHKVQMRFFGVITDNLHFNCEYEDDLVLLTEVVEMLGKTGEFMIGLDLKAMAELWKGYINLVQANAEHLRPRLDVASPIKFLIKEVVSRLKAATDMNQNEMKAVTQTLRIGSFSLKIINKLCEGYVGYLGDCHKDLLNFLLTLNLNCQSYLQWKSIPSSIAEGVERHLVVGADPLLSLLLGQLEFVDSYFQCEIDPSNQENQLLGFILLSNAVLIKLLHCDPSVRQLWHNNNRSILSKIFCGLDNCHAEMCWELNVPSSTSENTQLYKSVLNNVAAFVVCIPADEFHLAEQVLLESVLQPRLWRAMLASDVWCVLARYGSSELCFEHVCYLVRILQGIPGHVSRPERTHLTRLLGRLFPLLSDKSKSEVVALYPPCENVALWETLQIKHLPETLKLTYANKIMDMVNDRIEVFLFSSASVDIYNSMLESLSVVPSVLDSDCEIKPEPLSRLRAHVVTLWRCATLPKYFSSEESSEMGSQWLNRFTASLCKLTSSCVVHVDNSELLQVLRRLHTILPNTSSSVKISAIGILKALGTKFVEPNNDQNAICRQIGSLFSTLLEDQHALVHQKALETFACFAYVTKHEGILAMAVNGSSALESQVATYLQKITTEPIAGEDKLMSYNDYLRRQSQLEFIHKCCYKKVRADVELKESFIPEEMDTDSGDRAAKRPKLDVTDKSLLEAISRMEQDVRIIASLSRENGLSQEARIAIKNIEKQLGQITLS